MKRPFALLALLFVLLVACAPTDAPGTATPTFDPKLPTNPDEALGATVHLTNTLDAALYLEAEGNLDELPNGLPPLVRTVLDTFGFWGDLSTYSPTCDVSRTDADADGDNLTLRTYTVNCAVIQEGAYFVLFSGELSTGDPDDADPSQAYAYGYRFNNLGVMFSTYDPTGNLINTSMTLSGAINYDADASLIRNEADFNVRLQHAVGSDTVATFIFYPAHPAAVSATPDPSNPIPILTLTPQLGNYSTPHWQVNYGSYVNVTTIDLPAGDLTFDPSCAPLSFAAGTVTYTDENGDTLEVAYPGCFTSPAFSTTLLP